MPPAPCGGNVLRRLLRPQYLHPVPPEVSRFHRRALSVTAFGSSSEVVHRDLVIHFSINDLLLRSATALSGDTLPALGIGPTLPYLAHSPSTLAAAQIFSSAGLDCVVSDTFTSVHRIISKFRPQFVSLVYDTERLPRFLTGTGHGSPAGPLLRGGFSPKEFQQAVADLKRILPELCWVSRHGIYAEHIIARMVQRDHIACKNSLLCGGPLLHQLIDRTTAVYDPLVRSAASGNASRFSEILDLPTLLAQYEGLQSAPQVAAVLLLQSVDAIGTETALSLVRQFESLEGIYANLPKVEPRDIREKLKTRKKQVFDSKAPYFFLSGGEQSRHAPLVLPLYDAMLVPPLLSSQIASASSAAPLPMDSASNSGQMQNREAEERADSTGGEALHPAGFASGLLSPPGSSSAQSGGHGTALRAWQLPPLPVGLPTSAAAAASPVQTSSGGGGAVVHVVSNDLEFEQCMAILSNALTLFFYPVFARDPQQPFVERLCGFAAVADSSSDVFYVPVEVAPQPQFSVDDEVHSIDAVSPSGLQQQSPESPRDPRGLRPTRAAETMARMRDSRLPALRALLEPSIGAGAISPHAHRRVLKVFHDAKSFGRPLQSRFGFSLDDQFDDIMVMSYVLYCGRHKHDLDSLRENLLGHDSHDINNRSITSSSSRSSGGDEDDGAGDGCWMQERDVLGTGRKKKSLLWLEMAPKVALLAAQRALTVKALFFELSQAFFDEPSLYQFYQTVEKPLIRTLLDMETTGIFVDRRQLEALLTEKEAQARDLSERILKLSGKTAEQFNINSTLDLSRILYEEMGLKPPPKSLMSKKGNDRTAVSVAPAEPLHATEGGVLDAGPSEERHATNASALQLLAKDHELPRLVLEYRAVSKILSTYVRGLLERIDPRDGRIHTHFQNALTATGRLSSVEPNLQNIPIRTEEGRRVRSVFCAQPGYSLLSCDYSQVELRILAHVSRDTTLRDAFLNDKDVHAITASQVFGVALDKVDKDLRRKAKAINFGIVYGMTAIGLSKQLSVTTRDAEKYIASYKKQYPGIVEYMEEMQWRCKKYHYVETLFGRRCYIPAITSSNRPLYNFALRAAINTPIQGSSADITKMAMNRIRQQFRSSPSLGVVRMLLQVHDELIFEVPDAIVEDVWPVVKEAMEGVGADIGFSIPLTVGRAVSKNWDDK